MSAGHTSAPWYVFDQRETYMRSLGWPGPFNDAILISAKSPREALEAAGENSIVARISFDNRPEKLGESNLADARLIAAAPDLLDAARLACETLAPMKDDDFVWATMSQLVRAIAKATGAAS